MPSIIYEILSVLLKTCTLFLYLILSLLKSLSKLDLPLRGESCREGNVGETTSNILVCLILIDNDLDYDLCVTTVTSCCKCMLYCINTALRAAINQSIFPRLLRQFLPLSNGD